jgi:valyl-tRNA synthetase
LANKDSSQNIKLEIQNRRPRAKNKDDKWILNELKMTTQKVSKALDKYRLNEAAEAVYDFIWHKFADIYLEKSKSRRRDAQKILEYGLQQSLKLLHPFMPFVTEVIWSLVFARNKKDLLINASWPN